MLKLRTARCSAVFVLLSAILASLGTASLTASRSDAAPRSAHETSTPSPKNALAHCVRSWNMSPLGPGRLDLIAAAKPGAHAYMSRSRDGVCLLALPAKAATSPNRSPEARVFIDTGIGDYGLLNSPDTGVGSTRPPINLDALARGAGARPNVTVPYRSGRVVSITDRRAGTVPYTIRDSGSACKTVQTPAGAQLIPARYAVTQTDASCDMTRAIIFAYVAGEGHLIQDTKRQLIRKIIGWRCTGTISLGTRKSQAPVSLRLACRRGQGRLRAKSLPSQVVGPAVTAK